MKYIPEVGDYFRFKMSYGKWNSWYVGRRTSDVSLGYGYKTNLSYILDGKLIDAAHLKYGDITHSYEKLSESEAAALRLTYGM